MVEAMATTGGGPLLALLCATEGDGEALGDGRHALNAMAGRPHHSTPCSCEISMRKTGGWIRCYRGRDSFCPASWALLVVSTCVGVIQGVCERERGIGY
jgi:hypothetical protein